MNESPAPPEQSKDFIRGMVAAARIAGEKAQAYAARADAEIAAGNADNARAWENWMKGAERSRQAIVAAIQREGVCSVSPEAAYNRGVDDAKAAIRSECGNNGPDEAHYYAATYINAIARKCDPRRATELTNVGTPDVDDETPLDMLLFCPQCGEQHIDQPQPEKGWTNPPHKSHECQFCGAVWRPADHPTNGVLGITTKGKVDSHSARPRYFATEKDFNDAVGIHAAPQSRQRAIEVVKAYASIHSENAQKEIAKAEPGDVLDSVDVLAQIRERVKKATAGPWAVVEGGEADDYGIREARHDVGQGIAQMLWRWDAYFVAHAREDIPYLLSLVTALRAENEELKRKQWPPHIPESNILRADDED